MENYLQKLLIVKDVENLTPFARRHDKIATLNLYKTEAFNKNGITSTIYLSVCAQLFDLYTEDEDFENAKINALNIYQGTMESSDENAKIEATINLANAYINENDIIDTKSTLKDFSVDKSNKYYSLYCLCLAKLARFEKDKDRELCYLRDAYNYSIKHEIPIEVQINILCALCLAYERHELFQKALQGYLELSNQIAQSSYQITTEQQISLEVRIARLANIGKNYTLSLEILSTVNNISPKVLRKNHPLIGVVQSQYDKTKQIYSARI
ncbi:MAG: hypothetical protein ACRQFF_02265 [Sphaerochaeta sp.]